VNDISFVNALLDTLADELCLDRRLIFATGHSNGGLMAYEVGQRLSHRFAAIAPIGAAPHVGYVGEMRWIEKETQI
jgi:polyhydroxybutyrate depolymerase